MNPFLTLDETSINPASPVAKRDDYSLREAARAVVMDSDKQVALLYVRSGDYYKLPGGGVDEGEDVPQTLKRELLEEIGCEAEVVANLGTVREFRFYWDLEQLSYCFLAEIVGEKGEPQFTDKEQEDGFEIVWANNLDKAIALLDHSRSQLLGTDPEDYNKLFMRLRDKAIAQKARDLLRTI